MTRTQPRPRRRTAAPPSRQSAALVTPARGAVDAANAVPEEPPGTLPALLKLTGAALGSTTVLTGLLFYFGRLHITGFFRYFRVNFTVLDLTANDYLIRSADGLFVPLTVVAVTGLLVLWVDRFVLGRLRPPQRARVLRVAAPVAAVLGLLLVALSLHELFADQALVGALPWLGGVALSGGVLLLAYAAHVAPPRIGALRRRPTDLSALVEGGFAILLVTIGLFWAVGSYAIDVGTGRARETAAALPLASDAVLYSARSLRLAVAGVTEVRCQDPEAAYRFRYDGLKLVLQSGNQYLLVSARWNRESGTAVLLPRSDDVRLEFAPPGQQRSPIC
jgi:hypothetical protein